MHYVIALTQSRSIQRRPRTACSSSYNYILKCNIPSSLSLTALSTELATPSCRLVGILLARPGRAAFLLVSRGDPSQSLSRSEKPLFGNTSSSSAVPYIHHDAPMLGHPPRRTDPVEKTGSPRCPRTESSQYVAGVRGSGVPRLTSRKSVAATSAVYALARSLSVSWCPAPMSPPIFANRLKMPTMLGLFSARNTRVCSFICSL